MLFLFEKNNMNQTGEINTVIEYDFTVNMCIYYEIMFKYFTAV